MKFSEIPEKKATALIAFYTRIVDVIAQEQRAYSLAGFRLLLMGNGAGIVLLASTLAGLYTSNASRGALVTPFILFLLGALFAGLAYFPVIAVASGAAKHIGESVEKFIKDEIDLEQLQGWGHSKASLNVLRLFVFISFVCLILGAILIVKAIL